MQISLLLLSSSPHASVTALRAIRVIITFPTFLPRSYHLNLAPTRKKNTLCAAEMIALLRIRRLTIRPLRTSNHVCPFLLHSLPDPSSWLQQPCWSERELSETGSFVPSCTQQLWNPSPTLPAWIFCPVRKVTIQQCCRVQLTKASNSAGFKHLWFKVWNPIGKLNFPVPGATFAEYNNPSLLFWCYEWLNLIRSINYNSGRVFQKSSL